MTLAELLESFKGIPILVIGDLMLDEYHFGRATRISPEAPVMVIRHEETNHLPGGAANVALNVKALGASPTLIGVAGVDAGGDELEICLRASGLPSFELIRAEGRRTTRKTRVVADHAHQVLRMDSEDDREIDSQTASQVLDAVRKHISGSRALILSDYLKGVLKPGLVRSILELAKGAGVPVVVNPKPRSLAQYAGADLISLNRLEASEATGSAALLDSADAPAAASELKRRLQAKGLLITLGEGGLVAVGDSSQGETSFRVPAPKVEVYDTAGAGDTAVATVALGLATAGFQKEVFELAVQTAACVVRHVGVATPSREDLNAIASIS